jgi:F0F1-type ATP synthase membrane subunit c/vacuolar-type H+-ATPase subunit K
MAWPLASLRSLPVSAWGWQPASAAWARAALARNPGARPGILLLLTLGLAFIESLSLFTLVIIFVKVQPTLPK